MPLAFFIGIIFASLLIYFGHPWEALVAISGPVLAWIISILGISAAGILSFLSGGGSIPIVAGIGFIVTVVLAIISFFK